MNAPSLASTIDIDPDIPSGFELLATAALQQEKTVPEEVPHRIPAETISVSDLVMANLPQCLQDAEWPSCALWRYE